MVYSSEIKRSEFYVSFLETVNGLIKLSPKEIEIFAKMLEVYNEIKTKTDNDEIASELLFSPRYREKVKAGIPDMKSLNFNNYIVSLKRKGAIIEQEDVRMINPMLFCGLKKDINKYSIVFEFKIKDDEQRPDTRSEVNEEEFGKRDSDDGISEQELIRAAIKEGLAPGSNESTVTASDRTDLGL